MRNHICYLVPELFVLAMFDSAVSNDEKQHKAATLLRFKCPQVFAPGNPGQPNDASCWRYMIICITDSLVGSLLLGTIVTDFLRV